MTQIRSGHCPLNSYLFRFKSVDSPNCTFCDHPEDVEHLLLNCRKFARLRRSLAQATKDLGVNMTRKALLTSPASFEAVATFCRISHRFYHARHKAFIPPQIPPPGQPPPRRQPGQPPGRTTRRPPARQRQPPRGNSRRQSANDNQDQHQEQAQAFFRLPTPTI